MEKYDSNLHSFMKKYKEEQIEIDVIRENIGSNIFRIRISSFT